MLCSCVTFRNPLQVGHLRPSAGRPCDKYAVLEVVPLAVVAPTRAWLDRVPSATGMCSPAGTAMSLLCIFSEGVGAGFSQLNINYVGRCVAI